MEPIIPLCEYSPDFVPQEHMHPDVLSDAKAIADSDPNLRDLPQEIEIPQGSSFTFRDTHPMQRVLYLSLPGKKPVPFVETPLEMHRVIVERQAIPLVWNLIVNMQTGMLGLLPSPYVPNLHEEFKHTFVEPMGKRGTYILGSKIKPIRRYIPELKRDWSAVNDGVAFYGYEEHVIAYRKQLLEALTALQPS
jgi:hypothetical protein